MNEVTLGQAVIVTDRRHHLAYEEGTVFRAKPDHDGRVRVRFPRIEEEAQPDNSWHAIELEFLGAIPSPGERYEWADRNNASRVPFTVGERFERGHRHAGLFRIMSDDATEKERRAGFSSTASAAEIAKFAAPAPTLAPLSLADRMRKWADDGLPRPGHDVGAPVRQFADEVQALQARADAAEAVVTAALAWEAAPRTSHLIDLGNAVRAYRTALRP